MYCTRTILCTEILYFKIRIKAKSIKKRIDEWVLTGRKGCSGRNVLYITYVGVGYDHYVRILGRVEHTTIYTGLQLLHLQFRSFTNYFDWLTHMDDNNKVQPKYMRAVEESNSLLLALEKFNMGNEILSQLKPSETIQY